MPPPQKLIDSHIHLWPAHAPTSASHAWMSAVPQLAKQSSVAEYRAAASHAVSFPNSTSTHPSDAARPHHLGYVYVETDRVLTAHFPYNEAELRWVEELCRGRGKVVDGLAVGDEELVRGVVLWAPMDRGPDVCRRYLRFIQCETPAVWDKLIGFRYLLQGIEDRAVFKGMVESDAFVETLKVFGGGERKCAFDVGVSEKVGLWQLEYVAGVMERLKGEGKGEGITFVLNHFCKPSDFDTQHDDGDGETWEAVMERLARINGVYMKLSGLFSELPKQAEADVGAAGIKNFYDRVARKFDVVLRLFGPKRCMFGSDWPVCNINGPSDAGTWKKWYEVVNLALESHGVSDEEGEWIWWRTANEAYSLGLE